MNRLCAAVKVLVRTPLHPQWLLGRRRPPAAVGELTGDVLDVGAADRWLAAHLGSACRYVALDYPSTGRDLYGARPDVFGDAGWLPFDGGAFDGVICLEVLEHVSDPDAALREVARVLKRGGRALFSMPFLYPVHDAPHDYQRWTVHGWTRSAARAGLQVVKIAPSGSAVRTAGLLACLAIAGPLQRATFFTQVLLGPVALLCVLAINLVSVAAERIWPRWDAMHSGLELELRRP